MNRTLNHNKLIFILLVFAFSVSSFYGQDSKNRDENFKTFYNRFTSDSIFQFSRIVFPLLGGYYNFDANLKVDTTLWDKSKWRFDDLNIFDIDTTQYKRSVKYLNTWVQEKMWIENAGFHLIRTFNLINGKWYLTDYSINDL